MSKPIYCECGRKIFVKPPRFGVDARRSLGNGGRVKGHDLCMQCMTRLNQNRKVGFVRAKVITYRTVVYDRHNPGWTIEAGSGASEGAAINSGHKWIKSNGGDYSRYYFRLEPMGTRNEFVLDRGE